MHHLRTIRLALLCFAAACGSGAISTGEGSPDAGSAPLTGLTTITITPSVVSLTIDGDTPAQQDYSAVGTFSDGHMEDVTHRVGWFLTNAVLGNFSGAHFTSSTLTGGHTQVYARYNEITTFATLALVLKKRGNDPGSTDLPTDPGSKFGGTTDASRNPDVVYPNDGVLLPPNLGIIEVHYKPGSAMNTLFEIDFTNSVTDVRVYARCKPLTGGCFYTPTGGVWGWISSTNQGGEALQVSVRGTDDAGSKVGSSTGIAMSFSQDTINGGIYYWTTFNGSVIMRYDFAGSDTAAQVFVDNSDAGGHCVGCHALSSDGKKMVAEIEGRNNGNNIIFNVAKVTNPFAALGTTEKSIFESWNPDASMYVGVYGDSGATDYNLLLMDGTTGVKVGHIDVGGTKQGNGADHPDWSPDGTRIAFTQVGADSDSMQRQWQGAIRMATKSGTDWHIDTLVDHGGPGTNHYYPSFSPVTGELLVFDSSHCDNNANSEDCDGDTDPSASLNIMKPQVGAQVIPLAKANTPGKGDGTQTKLTNTYPRWSPFVFRRVATETASRLMWLTFSSTRAVGLRPAPPPGQGSSSGNVSGTYIWMAAIDPDRALGGFDPSYPAFYLPFQDPKTSNHIAQWTKVVTQPIP